MFKFYFLTGAPLLKMQASHFTSYSNTILADSNTFSAHFTDKLLLFPAPVILTGNTNMMNFQFIIGC